jgi:hypothetical protein
MIDLGMNKNTIILIVLIIILVVVGIIIWSIFDLGAYFLFGIAAVLAVICYWQSTKQAEPRVLDAKPVESEASEIEKYVPEVEEPKAALRELPIETIEGIGATFGNELRAAGIETVEDLLGSDPETVANICDVSVEVAERWIAMGRFTWLDTVSEEDAEAIVEVSEIKTLEDLAKADAVELLERIKAAVAAGDVRIPSGYEFTLEKVEEWINEAKGLV